MKKFYGSLAALALLLACAAAGVTAQTKKSTKTDPTMTDNLLAALPASDAVALVDARRLLNEALPRIFAGDAARLAQVNARIDNIKTRTGIDLRAFERVAIGMRYVNPTPDKLQAESVALARGSFDAGALLDAALLATKDRYNHREEKYKGKTIYIFKGEDLIGKDELPQNPAGEQAKKESRTAQMADDLWQKVLGLRAGDVGVVALDANTLAFGQLARVRAAIEAGAGRGRVDSALTALALRGRGALIGFSANMPANASRYLGFDNDEIAKNLDAIRQVYGSLNMSANAYELLANTRTETAAQAQGVYNTLVGFRDLGGYLAGNLSGERGKLAKTALENLKITKEGNEAQIRLELSQPDVVTLVGMF